MSFTDLITRGDADALIPEELAASIIEAALPSSAALSLMRRVPMSHALLKQPVLDALPAIGWINSDTGLKPTSTVGWEGVYLIAEELAAIVPVPENVLDDAAFSIWDSVQPTLAAKLGNKLDAAVFGADPDKPITWTETICPGAEAANKMVTIGSPQDVGGIAEDINLLMLQVEESGFEVTGFTAVRSMRGLLRGARDTTGQRLLDTSTQTIEGVPVHYVPPNVLPAGVLMVAGDFSNGVLGVRKDTTFKLLDQAVISDETGKIVLNLPQQDSLGLRVTARFGFAVANPATVSPAPDPYPFALLKAAGASPADAGSAKKAA